MPPRTPRLPAIEPMYATVGTTVPEAGEWTFEPKLDGMRVLAFVTVAGDVRLVTRNGKRKEHAFPEIVAALAALGKRAKRALVVDGEVTALERDEPGRFQTLQQRMHVTDAARIPELADAHPTALFAFDLLVDGPDTLVAEPWTTRRARLARLLARTPASSAVRLTESTDDARTLLRRAQRQGWEGVIAKRTAAPYIPGARSRDWLKLKLQYRAEFVVGGFTAPRNSREHLGALVLGYYDAVGALAYAGHMGGGFDRSGLRAMSERLTPLVRATTPFAVQPKSKEPVQWVKPVVVVEVKFAEWTADGRLRQPIFLGVRDDKPARRVTRERQSMQEWGAVERSQDDEGPRRSRPAASGDQQDRGSAMKGVTARKRAGAKTRASKRSPKTVGDDVVAQLAEIERTGGDGELRLGRKGRLDVSSLGKPYFPDDGLTKGDVLRYYATVAPVMLSHLEDRPLILTRFPAGIEGHRFYQQNVPDGMPESVRREPVEVDGKLVDRIVGCDLPTLLYLVQMGTIVMHTWHSRIGSLDQPDYALIDLDPGEGVPLRVVVSLAREIRAIAHRLDLVTAVKTSGSRGIHIVFPLPRGSDYGTSAALAARIAEQVAQKMPELATLERRIAKRPRGTVLLDVNQNARGKSMVAPYAVRARTGATVSAPILWTGVGTRLTLEQFTVRSMPRRIARMGDLWGEELRGRNTARAIAAALRSR